MTLQWAISQEEIHSCSSIQNSLWLVFYYVNQYDFDGIPAIFPYKWYMEETCKTLRDIHFYVFNFTITNDFPDTMLHAHICSLWSIFIALKSLCSVVLYCCIEINYEKRMKGDLDVSRSNRDTPRSSFALGGLTKTIMYRGVSELSIDTAKQCFLAYSVTNDRLLISCMVA